MFPDSSNYIGEPKTNNRKVGIYIKWKATVYTVIKQTKYDDDGLEIHWFGRYVKIRKKKIIIKLQIFVIKYVEY